MITRRGEEVARLVAARRSGERRFGIDRGRFVVPEDFDAPARGRARRLRAVRLLLDTHVFLWLQTEPERHGEQLATVEHPRNELLLSAASSWEIALKHALGRLRLPEPPERYVPQRMRAIGAVGVAIEPSHALAASALPSVHRDPFDRLS